VRSVATHSSGKYYCEITITNHAAPDNEEIALGISSTLGTNHDITARFTGEDPASCALWPHGTTACNVYLNGAGTNLGNNLQASTGQIWAMAVDMDASPFKLWWKNITTGTGWNASGSNDPAAGTGAYVATGLAAVPPWAINVDIYVSGGALTLNAGGSAYAATPPSGFGNW
jgi:hypothetical protein